MNWNHVEIKLPPVNEKVLVVTRNGKYSIAMRYLTPNGNEYWSGSSSFADSIVAWMKLPQCQYIDKKEVNGLKAGDKVEFWSESVGERFIGIIDELLTNTVVIRTKKFGLFIEDYSNVKKI